MGIVQGVPTPGSEADAWRNDETDIRNKYAKRMGIDGETLSQSHGALQHTVSYTR